MHACLHPAFQCCFTLHLFYRNLFHLIRFLCQKKQQHCKPGGGGICYNSGQVSQYFCNFSYFITFTTMSFILFKLKRGSNINQILTILIYRSSNVHCDKSIYKYETTKCGAFIVANMCFFIRFLLIIKVSR
jgi:hypothetical protein